MTDVKPATAGERAEWKRLAEVATPGPWVQAKEEYDSHEQMAADTGMAYSRGGHVLHYLVIDGAVFPALTGNGPKSKANAAFIAAARTAVPALEAALVEAEAERDAYKKRLDDELENNTTAKRWEECAKAFERERDELKRLLVRRVEADRLSAANERIAVLEAELAEATKKANEVPGLSAALDEARCALEQVKANRACGSNACAMIADAVLSGNTGRDAELHGARAALDAKEPTK